MINKSWSKSNHFVLSATVLYVSNEIKKLNTELSTDNVNKTSVYDNGGFQAEVATIQYLFAL